MEDKDRSNSAEQGASLRLSTCTTEAHRIERTAANLKLTKNDGKRIEGAYATRNASAKRSPDTQAFDLTFALDVAPSK